MARCTWGDITNDNRRCNAILCFLWHFGEASPLDKLNNNPMENAGRRRKRLRLKVPFERVVVQGKNGETQELEWTMTFTRGLRTHNLERAPFLSLRRRFEGIDAN